MSTSSGAKSKTTTDHAKIQRWAEERNGTPSCVRGTGGGDDIGILRIDFPGYSGQQKLQPIEWDEFFDKFDERGLALVYQDKTATGRRSNFNKLISREDTKGRAGTGNPSTSRSSGKSRGRAGSSRVGAGRARGGSRTAGGARGAGSKAGGGSRAKGRSGNR